MTLTTYPASTDPSDLAALNLSRLLSRLEYNILSPNADLKSLRRSEYQRMRVAANVEYARTTLQGLERSLPQIKPVERRHDLQSSLARNRQTLKQLQNVLDEIQSEEEARASSGADGWDEEDEEDDAESEDLLGTPEGGSTTDEAAPEDDTTIQPSAKGSQPTATTSIAPSSTLEETPSPTPTAPTSTSATTSAPAPAPPALRNRHHNIQPSSSTPASKATSATGTSLHPTSPSPNTAAETEAALSDDRAEQETLTNSLLSLATQLKSSSQAFQASLEADKSALSRAAEGLDRTTGSLAAAEKRMGLLRRMTEGKGWWGRMMLYAWIFGLWVVAVLIVFVGPKLRF
ncbi:hypothetical protein BJY04DRAFT_193929 [Aspergillus karnatakaensis]|uniref:uncharacterized protein n=1 Tax=Aspergillus karnatakaensis TaxID=1810916 RepID=UPI003CCD7809